MLRSGPLQAVKGLARQIQGALPVLGLLSRLSSPSGGIGNDVLVSSLVHEAAVLTSHRHQPQNRADADPDLLLPIELQQPHTQCHHIRDDWQVAGLLFTWWTSLPPAQGRLEDCHIEFFAELLICKPESVVKDRGHAPCAMQRYPEFCRKLLYEEASPEFLEATSEWEKAYGKVQSAFYGHGLGLQALANPCLDPPNRRPFL